MQPKHTLLALRAAATRYMDSTTLKALRHHVGVMLQRRSIFASQTEQAVQTDRDFVYRECRFQGHITNAESK